MRDLPFIMAKATASVINEQKKGVYFIPVVQVQVHTVTVTRLLLAFMAMERYLYALLLHLLSSRAEQKVYSCEFPRDSDYVRG